MENGRTSEGPGYVGKLGTILGALVIMALGVALISALVNLWPVVDVTPTGSGTGGDTGGSTASTVNFLWGAFSLSLTKSTGLIVLAVIAGALGSFVHATLAFTHWVGEGQLKRTWLWWYTLRLFSGAVLALLVYFAIRGGLFGGEDATSEVNAYGTAAFAGLVGLFSKQALEKLREVLNTLFSTKDDASSDPGTTPQEAAQGETA